MMRYIIIAISLMVLLSGCRAAEAVKKEEIPIFPIEILKRYSDDAASIVIPLHLHDQQLHMLSYHTDGSSSIRTFDDITFPVQIWMIYNEPNVQVFLARAPKSGCTLQWHKSEQRFEEICLGTKYARDGQYLDGPPARALDELPVRIQDNIIWVSNQIIYGELPEEYAQ